MRFKSKKNSLGKIIGLVAISLVLVLVVFTATSCFYGFRVVKGSGNITSEKRDIGSFDKIDFAGMGNIIIEQGDEESLEIEAEDNIIPHIRTDVFAGELVIENIGRSISIIPTEPINLYIKVKDLDSIALSGAGNINCEDFETEDLKLELNGAGNIVFFLDAKSLETEISGIGDIDLIGQADNQKIIINGGGNYNAEDLVSKDCFIEISGIGSARVNVSNELDIGLNGTGNVYYKGNPSITQDISGLGKISNIN